MEIYFKVAGVLLIVLSALHAVFPKYFKWEAELIFLSLVNRQMFYIHTFFIALLLLLMGLLCLTSAPELINTSLGKKVSLGLAVFWLARLVIQFFGYSSELWRGKKFETSIHILFSVLWMYFCWVFVSAVI
jgi:hypothetical protein